MLKLMLLQVKTNVAQMRGGSAARRDSHGPRREPRNLRSHSSRPSSCEGSANMSSNGTHNWLLPSPDTSGCLARFDGFGGLRLKFGTFLSTEIAAHVLPKMLIY